MSTATINELSALLSELSKVTADIDNRGVELASAEYRYRVEFSKALLQGRAEGYPATLLLDVCRGLDTVANARFQRDVAQAGYDATRERINAIMLNIRILDGQLNRDLELAGKTT